MIVHTAGVVRPGPVRHRMDPPGAILATQLVCRVVCGKPENWEVRTGSCLQGVWWSGSEARPRVKYPRAISIWGWWDFCCAIDLVAHEVGVLDMEYGAFVFYN